MIPLFNTDGQSTSPLGLPMCQNRLAVPYWSWLMEVYPPARIIELGTYGGGFTTALGVHAWRIGAQVTTYDRMLPDERFLPLGKFLGIEFRHTDIWAAAPEITQKIQLPGVTYLLCDGGDKKLELATFGASLKPGDVIAAHDYSAPGSAGQWWPWGEVFAEDGAAAIAAHGLVPFHQEHFDHAGWLVLQRPA